MANDQIIIVVEFRSLLHWSGLFGADSAPNPKRERQWESTIAKLSASKIQMRAEDSGEILVWGRCSEPGFWKELTQSVRDWQ